MAKLIIRLVDLSRLTTPASEGDTEQLISTMLPTATLVCVSMEFRFSGLVRGLPLASMSSILPIADTAIRGVWSNDIADLVPLCARPGYLKEVGEKASYIGLMAEEIEKITRRMGAETTNYRSELWKVLMKGLGERRRGGLKSLMIGGDPIEVLELNESPMLLDEPGAETEEDLFIFDEEGDDAYFLDSFGDGSGGSRSSSEILEFMDDEQEELLLQADSDSNTWI